MSRITELKRKYEDTELGAFSNNDLQEIRNELKNKDSKIESKEDAMNFLTLLRQFRMAVAKNDELHGENYNNTLRSILTVGENGLYSNSLRFLFELIQNVDDCEFSKIEDCSLDMKFEDYGLKGKIILTYNEVGFSAYNVFAITGIAEAAKNIEAGKMEIGEKGIGFKSVFGVADSVLIQSGWFSFQLEKNNFTVPESCYDKDFQKIMGTRMTLFMDVKKVHSIYRELVDMYSKEEALFNKNPILFLNKLNRLRFYMDEKNRNVEFRVTRLQKNENDYYVEQNVQVSVNLKDRNNGRDHEKIKQIECIRCVQTVAYDLKTCQSRYGIMTRIGSDTEKRMNLQAVIPLPESRIKAKLEYGTLYSFLPTQIELNIPIALHVPFKLDTSREFVDPQEKNEWFQQSCRGLDILLKNMYLDLAQAVKEQIVFYIVGKGKSIFKNTNEKVKCLYEHRSFMGDNYLKLPLFYTADNEMKTASEIVCINQDETEDRETAYLLLGKSEGLFLAPKSVKLKKFGIEVISNVNHEIFIRAFQNEEITEEALDYLEKIEEFPFTKKDMDGITENFTIKQIKSIITHEKFRNAFQTHGMEKILKNEKIPYKTLGQMEDIREKIYEGFEIDISDKIACYLKKIDYHCILLNDVSEAYLIMQNAIILSREHLQNDFANLCQQIDKDNLFSVNLKINSASEKLNELEQDSEISSVQYLTKLRLVRRSVKAALGESGYKSYIDLILNTGVNEERFLNELLQNADDCKYPSSEIPTFELKIEKDQLFTRYNERGFSKSDVRSITAIGESTKKKILRGEGDIIGEKGIGFKMVFASASEVVICSNGFYFKLSENSPTIPAPVKERISALRGSGTEMVFRLKKELNPSFFTEQKVLKLCMCLRRLKKITLGEFKVEIKEEGAIRKIIINGKKYQFIKYDYSFEIMDKDIISEREKGEHKFDSKQHIYCYIPEQIEKNDLEYGLYCGLPTEIKMNIPMYIDAPFELTTSREQVLPSRWSNEVKKAVYHAITQVIIVNRQKLRSKVMSLICFEKKDSEYHTNIFKTKKLNDDIWKQELLETNFLPTFDKSVFISPQSAGKRYPTVVNYLIKQGENISVPLSQVIDVSEAEYDSVLEALGCKKEKTGNVLEILCKFADAYISDEKFRKEFYLYAKKHSSCDNMQKFREMKIIPVYGVGTTLTEYIQWQKDKIFTKENVYKSEDSYWVLNEKVLSKSDCETIMGVRVSEMNFEFEMGRYKKFMKNKIDGLEDSPGQLYQFIMKEYKEGRLEKYKCFGDIMLLQKRKELPLKNVRGEITKERVFLNTFSNDLFIGTVMEKIIVHDECVDLAKEIGMEDLNKVSYTDMPKQQLSGADIEILLDDNFENSISILRKYVQNDYVSDELIRKYKLESLCKKKNFNSCDYVFPNRPVKDRGKLCKEIKKRWEDPYIIKKVSKQRIVDQIEHEGEIADIDKESIRTGGYYRYLPENSSGKNICFCQKCGKVKEQKYIEVNNIEPEPKYYWNEMHLTLCLECSKEFEEMRRNDFLQKKFITEIMNTDVRGDIPVKINTTIGEITFTQTHLAEIQEILRQKPDRRW